MKFIVGLLLCALSGFLIGKTNFPWWAFAPICLFIGLVLKAGNSQSFFYGFLGIGLLWFISLSFINAGNDSILASRLAGVLKLSNPILLLILTALIGGLVAGWATLSGSMLRMVFSKK